MATINLAPGSQYAAAARQRQQVLLTASFGLVVVVAAVGALLWFVNLQTERQLALAEQRLKTIEADILEREPDVTRIIEFEQKIKALRTILSDHIVWTPILVELERLIPVTTSLSSLDLNEESNILRVTGTTANLDQIAQFLSSLTSSSDRTTVFLTHELAGAALARPASEDTNAEPLPPEYEFTVNFTIQKP